MSTLTHPPAVPFPTTTSARPPRCEEQHFVLFNVSWPGYIKIGEALSDRPALRMTYDRGTLEFMTTSPRHELYKRWLGRFIETIAEELHQPIMSAGSMTFQREELERGFEHDDCFWIAHESALRGKLDWVASEEPPPDLALEIEVSVSAVKRMPLFAAFRVPEVWCCDGDEVRIHVLKSAGGYERSEHSLAFPAIRVQELPRFFPTADTDYLSAVAAVREWVRAQINKPG